MLISIKTNCKIIMSSHLFCSYFTTSFSIIPFGGIPFSFNRYNFGVSAAALLCTKKTYYDQKSTYKQSYLRTYVVYIARYIILFIYLQIICTSIIILY